MKADKQGERRRPHNTGGRAWSYVVTSQGTARVFSNHQKLEETRKNSSLETLGVWPCGHLDFRLPALRTLREHISVVVSHPVCGTLSRQPLKRTYPPVGSYLTQKENQGIITIGTRLPLTWLTSATTAPCLGPPLQPYWPVPGCSNMLPPCYPPTTGLARSQAGPVSDLCRCYSLCWKGSVPGHLQDRSHNLSSGFCSGLLITKPSPTYPSVFPTPTPYTYSSFPCFIFLHNT